MSVPEKPYTRKEAYLNAAATGDTSGIPETPYTREEMYLDAIAKNGGGGGGGSSTLSGLTDVDISNPTNGQTLVYNATSGKWENGEGGGGSGGGVLVVNVTYDDNTHTSTMDKTWAEISAAPKAVMKLSNSDIIVTADIFATGQVEGAYTVSVAICDPDKLFIDGERVSYSVELYTADSANGYPSHVYQ